MSKQEKDFTETRTSEEATKLVGQHITNMDKFSQAVLFDGIGKGQCRPTDYDAIIELDNKYWFAFEVKAKGKAMPYGQSLSYTRTADKWHKCGDVAYVFVVEHSETDTSKPIMLKDCTISNVYTKGKWIKAKNTLTVAQGIEKLKEMYGITKI